MKEKFYPFLKEKFNNIDFQLAKVLLGHVKEKESWDSIHMLLLILSRLSQEGQLSLSLSQWSGKSLHSQLPSLPEKKELQEILENFCRETQEKIISKNEDSLTPVLWIDECLYLNKNHFFEKVIVRDLQNRIAFNKKIDQKNIESSITKKILSQRFTLVNGGPGSGKTTLIFSLIEKALQHNENTCIKLLATTGKAANRIQQSLRESFERGKKESPPQNFRDFEGKFATILNGLVEEVETIHRFLQTTTGFIAKNDGRQKLFDLIIIDEASMISPSLLAQICLTINSLASLVLLGDRHQLPAVNSSNLIEDLLHSIDEKNQQHCVVTLKPKSGKTSHRFDENSPIAHIASTLRKFMDGESPKEEVVQTLTQQSSIQKEFQWHSDFFREEALEKNSLPESIEKGLRENLTEHYVELEKRIAQREKVDNAHHRLFDFFFQKMVLTSHRHGKIGEKAISFFIKNQIVDQQTSFRLNDPYHEGRIVLFLRNDYENQIFNGDIGIILKDQKESLRFYLYLSSRSLPVHCIQPENMETLYALTIHKSQGSEFGKTIVIFSPEQIQETNHLRNNTFLSPNLLYTALTRSKKSSLLYLGQNTLDQILSDAPLENEKTTPFRYKI